MKFLLPLFIAFSSYAFAVNVKTSKPKEQQPPRDLSITLTSPDYCFVTRFAGLALQPFANNLDYGAEAIPFDYGDMEPAVSPSWVIPEIGTDYHFGFDLGIAGIFHSASSSLSLNWQRFHSSKDSDNFTVDSASYMFGPFFEIGPDASVFKVGEGNVTFHFDEVNLDYGTFVRYGKLLDVQFFAGVSFSRLVQHRFTQFSDFAGISTRTLTVPAEFMGAGPQVGLDFHYKIAKGFQFVGNTRASLYVGTFKNKTTFSTASNDLVLLGDESPNIQTTTVYNKGGVVPGFEGRLGLAYEWLFKSHYMIQIEAGYQAQIYINAIRSTDMGSEVALGTVGSIGSATTGVYARTFERVVSDFSLAGPYGAIDFAF